jgi:hypothetical protein
MFTTNDVLDLLLEANPDPRLNDHTIRRAIRYRKIPRPRVVAGRYFWTAAEIEALAEALGLRVPDHLDHAEPRTSRRASGSGTQRSEVRP